MSSRELAPKFTCAEPQHDFGPAVAGDRLAHAFTIVNQGAAPLHIQKVEKSYSCSAELPAMPVQTGGSMQLEVVCDTRDRRGPFADVVTLYANDPHTPLLRLVLKAYVSPRLAFESTLVELETPYGQTRSSEVRLIGKLAEEARLSLLAIDEGGPHVTVLAAGNGRPQGLRVHNQAKVVGTHVGRVLVATGLTDPKQLSLPYTCRVLGNLTVTPTNPFFNLRQEGGMESLVTVTSTRTDFRLGSARVLDGPFSATVERRESGQGYLVRIRFLAGAIAPEVRGANGRIALISNDPAEPAKEIPLFAMGAAPRAR